MADSHRSRASPYGASKPVRKVKAASSSNQQVHPAKTTRPSPPPATDIPPNSPPGTLLPRIERRGEPQSSNNNSSSLEIANGSSLAMAISPQAREVPALVFRSRPVEYSETSPTTRSDAGGFADGPSAKAAWCTPRSPIGSHLASFFAASPTDELVQVGSAFEDPNGGVRATPTRLLSVEDNLRATDELYRVDLDKLVADNDKFFEVAATANQHLGGIQDELPHIATAFEQTSSALMGLSKEIAALHVQHESSRDKILAQLDEVFNQGTDEKLALVEALESEKEVLQHAHESEIRELTIEFRTQVDELERKYNAMEKTCLDELQQLQVSSAAQLARAQQTAAVELETLREAARNEREALELAWKMEVSVLKTSSETELAAVVSKSQIELSTLELRAQVEYEELQSSSSEQIRALREASASQFAEATDKLTQELCELQQNKDNELQELQSAFATERARFIGESEQEIAGLNMSLQDQFTKLNDCRIVETTALQDEFDAASARFTAKICLLNDQHAREWKAVELTTSQTVSSLTSSHAQEVEVLGSNARAELAQTVDVYETRLVSATELHQLEVSRLNSESASSQASLVDKYESELTVVRDEAKREKDRVTLSYETEIDSLKCSAKELLDRTVRAQEASAAQIRDLHSARVLQFETLIRDQEKKLAETIDAKDTELESRANQIRELQCQLDTLLAKHNSFVDKSHQLTARREMDSCEREMRLLAVQQELSNALSGLEVTRKELRAAGEDRHVKANTILELTFVIKSRDDEVERLRNALLDSVRSVNQKTEILELTAESLSSKDKELEATKAALRKESGKLSQVEESMHHKEELIEDTEIKVERMRLGTEALRLEMKRLQMDMQLQLEHTEGEMALKHGEISRLHAAQSELKQKNDFYQQTVGRLEESLSASQRQVDEAQRRIHLLKLEATQNADEARKTSDLLLEKEQALLVLGKDRQLAQSEKQRVQIQLNNLAQVVTGLHEKHERQLMLCEEIQTRFLRVLAETSAEKDERMRAEKHLLFLELAATKELVRHLESVEIRLTESKKENEGQRTQVQTLETQIQELNTVITELRDTEVALEVAKFEIQELRATVQENGNALARAHDQLRLESEASQADIATLNATAGELTAGKTQLSTELEALTAKKAQLSTELEALQASLDQQCALNRSLESELLALNKQREELTSTLSGEKLDMAESIERMLSELTDAKMQFTQQLSDTAGKLQATEDELQKLQSEHDLKAREVSELQAQASGLQVQISKLELKLNFVEAENEAFGVRSTELEQLLKDKTSDHLKDMKDSEHELLLKTQELAAFKAKLSRLEQNQRDALQAFEEEKKELCAKHEGELRDLHASSASQLQEQLASLSGASEERERLVEDHFRQLNEAQDARVKLIEQHELSLSALSASHSEELQRLSQDHTLDVTNLEAQLVAAATDKQALEKAHLEDLKRTQNAHEAELEARSRDLETSTARLAQDFEKQVETLAETTQREAELGRLRIAEEHLRKLEDIVESAHVRDEQQLSALVEAQARLTAKELQLDDAKQAKAFCEDQLAVLQRTCEQTELALAESKQLVAARTATIDNVRKELSSLREASTSSGGSSSDELLAMVRQQIDTHLWEMYQVDRAQIPGGLKLETESDFVECFKAFFRIRCSVIRSSRSTSSRKLNTAGDGGLVLSIDEVCSQLEGYESIVDKVKELYGDQREGMLAEEEPFPKLSDQVNTILGDHKRLVEHVQRRFLHVDSSPTSVGVDKSIEITSELEILIQNLETHAELLNSLGLLNKETQRARCDQMVNILEQHDSLMRHAAESSKKLQVVELRDFTGLLDLISEILALARSVTGQDERFQTLADLKSLITELSTLFSSFETTVSPDRSGSKDVELSEENSEPAYSPKSIAILDFVRDATRFVADCRQVLGMTTGTSPLDKDTTDVLACIQELMHVLHHFDAFQPASSSPPEVTSHSRPTSSSALSVDSNTSSVSSIQERVAAVLTFFDELHLMTDFAQNILDEECDSAEDSSTGSQSNMNSSASLNLFRALTRTPTPVSTGFNSDSQSELLQIEVPFPLDELEFELQAQELHSGQGDADLQGFIEDGSEPPVDSPLAESLMDISLVMNDHHRIISEAAHWVHKTAKLRQRRRSSKLRDGEAASRSDLGSEICRLVREHCALLSLSKKLFKLKDPRHDLASLLECLAILKRLTTRLPFFHTELLTVGSGSSQSNSDSSTSLASNGSSLLGHTGSQDSLATSLSVFACIEDIARHLQDYDFFLAQMRANSDKQWLSRDATRGNLNIEELTRELNTRLELLASSQSALGLHNPMLELPEFVQRVQELVTKAERLEPWRFPETDVVESSEVQDGDEHSECGRSDASEAHTEAGSTMSTATSSGLGLEAYARAFDKIECDLTTYSALMSWLRGVLPFAQSVESVDDLKDRVGEVLSQLELFVDENVTLKSEIVTLQAEKERKLQQLAVEDAFLADHSLVVEAVGSKSRVEVFQHLLDEQRRLTTKTGEVEASAFLETNFLVHHGLLKASNPDVEPKISTHIRLEIYKSLMMNVQRGHEATCRLEMLLEEQTQRTDDRFESREHVLLRLQNALKQADREEKAFLNAHEDILAAFKSEDESETTSDTMELRICSRIPIFEELVGEIARLQSGKRISDSERVEELVVLTELGLLAACNNESGSSIGDGAGNEAEDNDGDEGGSVLVESHGLATELPPPPPISFAQRLELYKELANLQAFVQGEKAAVEQEKSFLQSHKLTFDTKEAASSRMSIYRTLLGAQDALIDEKMEREVELGNERGFLESHDVDLKTHMDMLEAFVKLRDEIAERNQADVIERAFLLENKLWSPEAFECEGEDDLDLDAQEQFGVRIQVLSEFLEMRVGNQQAKQQREAAIEAEKTYLLTNTGLDASELQMDGPQYSRLHIYELLFAAQRAADVRREAEQSQLLERFPVQEATFLRGHGLDSVLEISDVEPASVTRTKVYEELLNRICQRDERIAELLTLQEKLEADLKAWDEVALKHADDTSRAEQDKLNLLTLIADRDVLISRLNDEFARDRAVEADRHIAEVVTLAGNHAENVKQFMTEHEEKVAGLAASSKLELAVALEKQAKQLEFLVLVRVGEENLFTGGTSALPSAQTRALLLDKVTKRDSSAISMIYRSIRLATDILNTSAFTGVTATANSASDIPVEVTQAVLNCVKELKALKEYLIDSLEQLTRGDDAFPSQPPAFVKFNVADVVATGNKEAAIDFALCSHREFMAFAHVELLSRRSSMDAGIAKLLATLKAVVGGNATSPAFTATETTFMELEMQLTCEKEARENADCKFRLNDEYYQRLLGERKDIEAMLTKALSELRDESRALRMKVDVLEQERYAAPGSSAGSGSMYGLSPSPRATPMTPSGGFGAAAGGLVMPIRPEKPREPPRTASKGAGLVHKERFVSDLEKETGQRRSTNTTRRISEWKKQDAINLSSSSSSQLERDFRAMETASSYAGYAGTQGGKTSPTYPKGGRGLETAGGGATRASTAQEQEVWYQGVRMVHHISFFVSMFYVHKQHLFRVEVFNSDTEQQQTVYVTWSEMQTFLDESKKALRTNLALDDPSKHTEVADILFERVRVYGEGSSNVLLGFE